MSTVKYAFVSSYLKGQEARLVTSEHIDRLAGAASVQDALGTVRETDVGSYLEELPDASSDRMDESLWKYLAQRIAFLEWLKLLPQDVRRILRAYTAKYDVFNIKAALVGVYTGKKAGMIPAGTIHNDGLLDELSRAESVDDIIRVLGKCKLDDYVPVLEQARADEAADLDLSVQARLEALYHRNLLAVAGRVKDGPALREAFGLVIDLANLQLALRAIILDLTPPISELTIADGREITVQVVKELVSLKLTEVPNRLENTRYADIVKEIAAGYERTKSVTVVDETIEKHKFRILKEMLALKVLSPLVAAWYLVLKETEVRNLRLVLKAIADEVPVQDITSLLVP